MTFDYGSETPPREFVSPPSLSSCIRLRSGHVKLLNFRGKLFNLRQCMEAIPLHRPKQHMVCLHRRWRITHLKSDDEPNSIVWLLRRFHA